ncbi:alpha/beta hydrolase family protein [Streptomyces silvisoli]|uniref:Hydrolase n=1 Tax=Streptomyces silvisoli TaxID=3034235 RepID=A0ABT5ZTH9_9ACTN|nr:hydrolase [Streptomyces silvisoli]MDF3292824.1 hydrolase [Streptomyces silvisoli]
MHTSTARRGSGVRRGAGLLLGAALAATALAAPQATAASNGPTLPAPTGSHQVGTVSLHLVDPARRDPWVAARQHRELMVSVRYPARDADRYPLTPQMLPGEAAGFDALNNFTGVPKGRVDWSATRSHAHEGAPVDRRGGPLPVVLYEPGTLDPRSLGTTLADDLASHGFVVVTIDHTYDASAVQFPGGRVERSVLPSEFAATKGEPAAITALLEKVMTVNIADTRFVLDQVDALAAGHDPDAEHRPLPRGLVGALDPHRVGMFGQSSGGMAALETMHEDPRITAGADLDGVLAYEQGDHTPGNPFPVATAGLKRPFLLMGMDGDNHHTVPSWGQLWNNSRGWHRDLTLRGGQHASFTDAESLLPQIARQLGLPASTVRENVGSTDPGQAVAAESAYLTAFFDQWLRGGSGDGLFDGPSPRFPVIDYVR